MILTASLLLADSLTSSKSRCNPSLAVRLGLSETGAVPLAFGLTFGGITLGFALEYITRSLGPGVDEAEFPGSYQGSLTVKGSTLPLELSFAMSAIVYSVATLHIVAGWIAAPMYMSVLGFETCLKILSKNLSYD